MAVATEGAVDSIIRAIQNAPATFYNLAFWIDSDISVFGPKPTLKGHEDSPRHGYSEELIDQVEKGGFAKVIYENSVGYAGAAFTAAPEQGEGSIALPLMMRLARALTS